VANSRGKSGNTPLAHKIPKLIRIDLYRVRTRVTMGTMGVKKAGKQSAKETLAEVTREMEKPRVASSARKYSHVFERVSRVPVGRVVENNVEK
jgi:hypothetical protein